jgi:hypothetical protein
LVQRRRCEKRPKDKAGSCEGGNEERQDPQFQFALSANGNTFNDCLSADLGICVDRIAGVEKLNRLKKAPDGDAEPDYEFLSCKAANLLSSISSKEYFNKDGERCANHKSTNYFGGILHNRIPHDFV